MNCQSPNLNEAISDRAQIKILEQEIEQLHEFLGIAEHNARAMQDVFNTFNFYEAYFNQQLKEEADD